METNNNYPPTPLYNEEPRIINTELACLVGLNEAIVLQQFHYWIEKNRKSNVGLRYGRYWTYGTIKDYMQRDFPFMSYNTLQRTLASLVSFGFIKRSL